MMFGNAEPVAERFRACGRDALGRNCGSQPICVVIDDQSMPV